MDNQKKILKISYELGLSHIGSCLSVLPILEEIYREKKPEDKVIMDNAHAHLAHLVVINQNNTHSHSARIIEDLIMLYGIHCERVVGCNASGGSLGHGIGIGIGMALANPEITVYVTTSDGALNEGSDWEALRLISDLKIKNMKVYVNCNGYTATKDIGLSGSQNLQSRLRAFYPDIIFRYTSNAISFLNGINGHYDVLTEETYQKALKELEYEEKIARDLT